ncbi:hypothetical protein FNF28_04437 [Cafeteria roenbergensis]|uniref:RING-type E3 ubiquitin transferase n=1 Tax=Cafeteria roenbergensis TaxID=33653 RepID=A0A5A8DEL2_CAFRO|nr:hypothetical protein FNF28_04437 [Cafeteria roenbergensis]
MAAARPAALETASFDCSICLGPVQQPVVTTCGHLYCWACLHRWMSQGSPRCPACKTVLAKDSIVPLYVHSHGGTSFGIFPALFGLHVRLTSQQFRGPGSRADHEEQALRIMTGIIVFFVAYLVFL